MRKGKFKVVRPAGMPGEENRPDACSFQLGFQNFQRLHGQFVALGQRGDKTVSAIRTEPEGISREQILVVEQIDDMTPCVAGYEEAVNLDIPDIERLAILYEAFRIVDRHLRQVVEMIDDLTACLTGQVLVLDLTDAQRCIPEQARAVGFDRSHMVGILMGDENMPDGFRVNTQPAHFFFQPFIIVTCVDHDGRIALAVKEDVRHPLPDTGNIFVDPAGVQRLEDLFAPAHPAHGDSLELGCFFRHGVPSVLLFVQPVSLWVISS